MSTDYTETLKRIKDTEEASSREILERRKVLEAELRQLEEASNASIGDAKRKGEAMVADEVAKTVKAAQKDADATLASVEKESKAISGKKLDKAALKKTIDNVVLAEFK